MKDVVELQLLHYEVDNLIGEFTERHDQPSLGTYTI